MLVQKFVDKIMKSEFFIQPFFWPRNVFNRGHFQGGAEDFFYLGWR